MIEARLIEDHPNLYHASTFPETLSFPFSRYGATKPKGSYKEATVDNVRRRVAGWSLRLVQNLKELYFVKTEKVHLYLELLRLDTEVGKGKENTNSFDYPHVHGTDGTSFQYAIGC